MLNVDRIFINADINDNELLNQCFIECNEEMKINKKINSFLYFPGLISKDELIPLENQLIINGHNGVFSTNKVKKAIFQDIFITGNININFDRDNIIDKMENNKKIVNMKCSISINSIDDKPLFVCYKNKLEYSIDKISARGPFNIVKNGDFIEVYASNNVMIKKNYIFNIEFIK